MDGIVTFCPNPAVDHGTAVEQVVPEHKLRCEEPSYEPGGGGLNVGRAVRALGGDALAVWTAGGAIGDLLGRLLDEEGLRHRAVPVRGGTRLNMTVVESTTGRQFRFGMPGPRLSADEAEACLDVLRAACRGCRYLVLSGSLPPGAPDTFYARAAEEAAARDTRVILDTSGPALRRGAEAGVFLLKPNLRELAQLAGEAVHDDEHAVQAARRVMERGGAEVVVVSLGAGGAFVVTRDKVEHVRAPTVPIRSRVGAGDSMVAGMVVRLAEGRPLDEAVRYGVASGAAAVTRPGTRLCRREDAERLFGTLSRAPHALARGGA